VLECKGNLAVSYVVQKDPTLTQVGMKSKLAELVFQFSWPKISKILSKLSIKKWSSRTINPNVINLGKTYSRDLRLIQNARLIFLDYTGFNVYSCIHYGYSPINTYAYQIVPENHGRNISLIIICRTYKLITNSLNLHIMFWNF